MRGLVRRVAIVLVLALAPLVSQAATINYRLTLTVETLELLDDYVCDSGLTLAPTLDCDWQAGDTIVGIFQLDDDTSGLADGTYPLIPLKSWRIAIGEVTWDMNRPFGSLGNPSDFAGFRDGGQASCGGLGGTGFSQINPGLIVTDGLVTGFCGGVYGSGDVPFIDFDYLYGPGRFLAADQPGVRLSGGYVISRVPEAGTFVLLVLGLVGLTFARRRTANCANVDCDEVGGR